MSTAIVNLMEKLLKEMRKAKVNQPKTPPSAIPPEVQREVKRLSAPDSELGNADEEMVQLLASVNILWRNTIVPASRKSVAEWSNESNVDRIRTAMPQELHATLQRIRQKKETAEKLKTLNKLIIQQALMRSVSKDLTSATFNTHAYNLIRFQAKQNIQELDRIIGKLDVIIRAIEGVETSTQETDRGSRSGYTGVSAQRSPKETPNATTTSQQPPGSAAAGANAAGKAGHQPNRGSDNQLL